MLDEVEEELESNGLKKLRMKSLLEPTTIGSQGSSTSNYLRGNLQPPTHRNLKPFIPNFWTADDQTALQHLGSNLQPPTHEVVRSLQPPTHEILPPFLRKFPVGENKPVDEWTALQHFSAVRSNTLPSWRQQIAVPAAYYCAGTSRAIIFRDEDLPQDANQRKTLFLQAIGAPDSYGRQLNGMGAGMSSLSKICIVKARPARDPIAQLDYTIVGMGSEGDEVDFSENWGNLSATIGPFAFNQRMLQLDDHRCYFRYCKRFYVPILNTNTGVVISSGFVTEHGQAEVKRTTSIDGVCNLGTNVSLRFLHPGGSKTGQTLPTGNIIDYIDGLAVSCVDVANPCVFVRATDIEIEPSILPQRLLENAYKLQILERIRAKAAIMMGLCGAHDTPPRGIPKIAIVSAPIDQTILSGEIMLENSHDVVTRFISDGQPHRSISLTDALCTAAAAKMLGSVVYQCVRPETISDEFFTVGHPSGRIRVSVKVGKNGCVERTSVYRTARRLMDGNIYWNPCPGSAKTPVTLKDSVEDSDSPSFKDLVDDKYLSISR